jgi:hypothetical protein
MSARVAPTSSDDRAAATAAGSVAWPTLFGSGTFDGSVDSLIMLFVKLSEISKVNAAAATYFETAGTVLQSQFYMYTDGAESAFLHLAQRAAARRSDDPGAGGRMIICPSALVARRAALPTAARRGTPIVFPDTTTPSASGRSTPPAADAPSTAAAAAVTGALATAIANAAAAAAGPPSPWPAGTDLAKVHEYKFFEFVPNHVGKELADHLRRVITDRALGNQFFDDAGGAGFEMLIVIERHVRERMYGAQASITYNTARAKLLFPVFAPKNGNARVDFDERFSVYTEFKLWAEVMCNDQADMTVLNTFVVMLSAGKYKARIQLRIEAREMADATLPTTSVAVRLAGLLSDIRVALTSVDNSHRAEVDEERLRASNLLFCTGGRDTAEVTNLKARIAALEAKSAATPALAAAVAPKGRPAAQPSTPTRGPRVPGSVF